MNIFVCSTLCCYHGKLTCQTSSRGRATFKNTKEIPVSVFNVPIVFVLL